MATTTLEQDLERVRDAIAKIESGASSYTLSTSAGNSSVTKADLNTLYEREAVLIARIDRASRGGTMRVMYV